MTQATLVRLISELETLEPEELQQLSQAIQVRLQTTNEADRLANFYNSLLASGLVRQIKQTSSQPQIKRALIEMQGKPISETIIEERR
jgi:alkylated DNA repair dioxygenase AlkB